MQFMDLRSQFDVIGNNIESSISKVLHHGKYILGPEVVQLERVLAVRANVDFCVSCANGTDALVLALMAAGIGQGDAVLTPSFTFAATAEAVALVGAVPIFLDVSLDDCLVDSESITKGVQTALTADLIPKAMIAVDLFGNPAPYKSLCDVAKQNNMIVIGDAAQSFGAVVQGVPVGGLADITTVSFFPSKPLGCYGDGGALFTQNGDFYNKLISLRVHGKGENKYDNVRVGMNSRLDSIQAAILLEKEKIFSNELIKRNEIAEYYDSRLSEEISDHVKCLKRGNNVKSAHALYTIVVKSGRRDELKKYLEKCDVPTTIYYEKPLHKQHAYKNFPVVEGGLDNTDKLCRSVLSLPMHPYLTLADRKKVVDAITSFF